MAVISSTTYNTYGQTDTGTAWSSVDATHAAATSCPNSAHLMRAYWKYGNNFSSIPDTATISSVVITWNVTDDDTTASSWVTPGAYKVDGTFASSISIASGTTFSTNSTKDIVSVDVKTALQISTGADAKNANVGASAQVYNFSGAAKTWSVNSITITITYSVSTNVHISTTDSGPDTSGIHAQTLIKTLISVTETYGADVASAYLKLLMQLSITANEAGLDSASLGVHINRLVSVIAYETGVDVAQVYSTALIQLYAYAAETGQDIGVVLLHDRIRFGDRIRFRVNWHLSQQLGTNLTEYDFYTKVVDPLSKDAGITTDPAAPQPTYTRE